ncbi:right-handed parallel beta-helix repeat-containing protein [Macrococcoides caseolyticum]|uniref:right-handed parallel beta-helix repeat-containing protein n=1 Tax=Macrococcoides caseolyticum TaxID=69966 RepID=UPI001F245959|nr:right-handed parallel beta-helix repeat-containing protein [Macrococcus caseolyticus]MCE4957988.1 hypothetical protein [Macrococcus caseolyticus]
MKHIMNNRRQMRQIIFICLFVGFLFIAKPDVYAQDYNHQVLTEPLVIKGSHLSVKNLTIKYSGDSAPLTITDSKDITLENVKVIGSNAANGIHIDYSSNIKMNNVTVSKAKDGVYLEHVDKIQMNQIQSTGNRYGIHFMYVTDGELTHSKVSDNITGIMLMVSNNIAIKQNSIAEQLTLNATGMTLFNSTDIKLHNNTFYKNSTALSVQGMKRSEVTNNTFENNLTALEIFKSDIPIQHNQFSNNITIANIDKQQPQFAYNLYDDPSIMDMNGDGIGDQPKRFSNLLGETMVKDTTINFFQNGPLHIILQWIENKSITFETGYQDMHPTVIRRQLQLNMLWPITIITIFLIMLFKRRTR